MEPSLSITKAEYLRDYVITITFNNGITEEVNLMPMIDNDKIGTFA